MHHPATLRTINERASAAVPAEPQPTTYRAEFLSAGSWRPSSMVFETDAEARGYAFGLRAQSPDMIDDFRVVTGLDPVNAQWEAPEDEDKIEKYEAQLDTSENPGL